MVCGYTGTRDSGRSIARDSIARDHTSPARSPEITLARSPEIATPADGRADPRGDGVHPHPRRRRRGVDGPRRPSGEQAARRAVAAPLARGCALALRRRAAAARGRPLPLAGGVCPRGGWRARERGERAREVGGSPDTSPAPDAHPTPAPLALRRAAPFYLGPRSLRSCPSPLPRTHTSRRLPPILALGPRAAGSSQCTASRSSPRPRAAGGRGGAHRRRRRRRRHRRRRRSPSPPAGLSSRRAGTVCVARTVSYVVRATVARSEVRVTSGKYGWCICIDFGALWPP